MSIDFFRLIDYYMTKHLFFFIKKTKNIDMNEKLCMNFKYLTILDYIYGYPMSKLIRME